MLYVIEPTRYTYWKSILISPEYNLMFQSFTETIQMCAAIVSPQVFIIRKHINIYTTSIHGHIHWLDRVILQNKK